MSPLVISATLKGAGQRFELQEDLGGGGEKGGCFLRPEIHCDEIPSGVLASISMHA